MTLALLFLLPCISAQDPAVRVEPAPRTTTTAAAPLVVKTAETMVATQMMMMMESGEDLPELKQGDHYILTMDGAGKMNVATATGQASLISLVARPGALMAIFREPIEESRSMADMMVGMALQTSGGDPADAEAMVEALFKFPEMVDVLRLDVTGDLEALRSGEGFQNGLTVELDLQPVADTPFHKFTSVMTPNPAGVPLIAKAPITMNLSLSREGFAALSKPMMDLSMAMAGDTSSPEMKELMATWTGVMDAYDGTMAVSLDPTKGSVTSLTGLRTPEKIAGVLNNPEYWKKTEKLLADQQMSGKATPNFMTHRDIPVHKLSAQVDDMTAAQVPFPFFQDGKMEFMLAVSGTYQLMTMFGDAQTAMKPLIDATKAGTIKRSPLPNNALMTMDVDILGIAQSMGAPEEEGMPKNLGIALTRAGSGLNLKLRLQ